MKNNFKDYGFEADFEGEILKEIDNFYYGIVNQYNKFETITWNLVGRPISGSTALNKYELWELKPIKKEWYENPDNFPCLVIHDNKESVLIKYYNKTNNKLISKDSLVHYSIDRCRPATKEEILSLLIEE